MMFSIIMPVYNAELFLDVAIQSVLSHSWNILLRFCRPQRNVAVLSVYQVTTYHHYPKRLYNVLEHFLYRYCEAM